MIAYDGAGRRARHTLDTQHTMSFLDHLEALRRHLLRGLIAIFLFSVVGFVWVGWIVDHVLLPPLSSDFVTFRMLCSWGVHWFCSEESGLSNRFQLINTSLPAQFLLHLQIAVFTGVILALPYVLFELWRFLKPGLYPHERRWVRRTWWLFAGLAGCGLAFGYFVLVPFAVRFLYFYQVSPAITNLISIQSYLRTFLSVMGASLLVFLTPLVLLLLIRMGLVTVDGLRRWRPYIFVGCFVLGAMLTPPDVLTQILVALPMYGLFELTVWVGKHMMRSGRPDGYTQNQDLQWDRGVARDASECTQAVQGTEQRVHSVEEKGMGVPVAPGGKRGSSEEVAR